MQNVPDQSPPITILGNLEIPVPPKELPRVLMGAVSYGGVRYDLFRRENNGLTASGALIFRGRRILIYPRRYLAWLESRPSHSA